MSIDDPSDDMAEAFEEFYDEMEELDPEKDFTFENLDREDRYDEFDS